MSRLQDDGLVAVVQSTEQEPWNASHYLDFIAEFGVEGSQRLYLHADKEAFNAERQCCCKHTTSVQIKTAQIVNICPVQGRHSHHKSTRVSHLMREKESAIGEVACLKFLSE